MLFTGLEVHLGKKNVPKVLSMAKAEGYDESIRSFRRRLLPLDVSYIFHIVTCLIMQFL